MIHSHPRTVALAISFFILTMLGADKFSDADAGQRSYSIVAGSDRSDRRVRKVRRSEYGRNYSNPRVRRYNRRGSQYGRNYSHRGYRVHAGKTRGSRHFGAGGTAIVVLQQPQVERDVEPNLLPADIEPLGPASRVLKVTEEQKRLGRERAVLRGGSSLEVLTVIAGKVEDSGLPGHSDYSDVDPDANEDSPQVIYFND